MTLLADLSIRTVFKIARLPVSRMRSDLATAVALDADVTFGVAGLA